MVAPLILAAGRALAARAGAGVAAEGAAATGARMGAKQMLQQGAQQAAKQSMARKAGQALGQSMGDRVGGSKIVQAPTHNGAAYGVKSVGNTQFSGFGQFGGSLNMGVRGVNMSRPAGSQTDGSVPPDRANISYRRPGNPGIGAGPSMGQLGAGPRGLPPGGSGPAALPAGLPNNLPVIPGGGQARFPDAIEVGAKTSPLYAQRQPKFKQPSLF